MLSAAQVLPLVYLAVVLPADKARTTPQLPISGGSSGAQSTEELPIAVESGGAQDMVLGLTQVEGIQFILKDELIYFRNQTDGHLRLCIPKALEQEIFKVAHDANAHVGFARTYDFIISNYVCGIWEDV